MGSWRRGGGVLDVVVVVVGRRSGGTVLGSECGARRRHAGRVWSSGNASVGGRGHDVVSGEEQMEREDDVR